MHLLVELHMIEMHGTGDKMLCLTVLYASLLPLTQGDDKYNISSRYPDLQVCPIGPTFVLFIIISRLRTLSDQKFTYINHTIKYVCSYVSYYKILISLLLLLLLLLIN